jgi:hypothetical protein
MKELGFESQGYVRTRDPETGELRAESVEMGLLDVSKALQKADAKLHARAIDGTWGHGCPHRPVPLTLMYAQAVVASWEVTRCQRAKSRGLCPIAPALFFFVDPMAASVPTK